PSRRPLKLGSITSTSGSGKEIGGAPGPHWRGGLVITLACSWRGVDWAKSPVEKLNVGTVAAAPASMWRRLRSVIFPPVISWPQRRLQGAGLSTRARYGGEVIASAIW